MDSFEIIKYIADSQRKTPLKVFLKGDLGRIDFKEMDFYGDKDWGGQNYAPYDCDTDGYIKAKYLESEIINNMDNIEKYKTL